MSSPNTPPSNSPKTGVKHQGNDTPQRSVGYKNPPKHTQFTKSGNPGGRPKRPPAVDFDSRLVTLLESTLPHSDKTCLDVIIRGAMKAAANGDVRSQKFLVDLYLDAKRRQRGRTSDIEADRQVAERVLASMTAFDARIRNTAEGPTPGDADTDIADE